MNRQTCWPAFGALVFAVPLLAQVPAAERIPITDADRLERLGRPRDARNVFEWAKLDRSGEASVGGKAASTPETWGTQIGSTTILARELQEVFSETKLTRGDYVTCTDTLSFTGGAFAQAQIQVPEGVSLGNFLSWMSDWDSDRDLYMRVWEVCQEYGYGEPVETLVAENQTIGAIGRIPGNKSLNGLTVTNHNCAYTIEVVFAHYGEQCTDDLHAGKFEITWTRQVSPPPATATFSDVPTSHPFFQFVEALTKSGITGGCGTAPPLYCPDEPLTRGQMAVFLAKGLGLQWP
jgi:S-layer homology domain